MACCSPWGCRVRHDWGTEQQQQCMCFGGRLLFSFTHKKVKPTLECLSLNPTFAPRGGSLVAQMVKNLPARWGTQVQSLDQKDALEKEMTTTLVLLPGEFHGQRNLLGYSPWSHKESDMTEWITISFPPSEYEEGSGKEGKEKNIPIPFSDISNLDSSSSSSYCVTTQGNIRYREGLGACGSCQVSSNLP